MATGRKEEFMFNLLNNKSLGSSKKQIDISDIKDGVLKISKSKYRQIIQVSSINFQLKSEFEQDNVIDNYESFLNSLNFSIQILIRTRQTNIEDYLETIDSKISLESDSIYKEQLEDQKSFINELIKSNKILNKSFYIIVPLDLSYKTDFENIKQQLKLRSELISKNLAKLNISSRIINTLEIIDLFYSFYNFTEARLYPVKTLKDFDEYHSLIIERSK